jgi:hypothetical protein
VHDGYEFSRQAKIHYITKYVKESKEQLFLRVCWESSGGSNCCRCEKCYRTILAIIAEGGEPRNYGFNFNNYEFWKMMLDLRSKLREYQDFWRLKYGYNHIQNTLRKNFVLKEIDKNIRWFYKLDLEQENKTISEFILVIRKKIFAYIKRKFLGF